MATPLSPEAYRRQIERRLAAQLVRRGSCLEWQGRRDAEGYGLMWATGAFMGLATDNNRRVHRVVWTLHHGPIPDGLNVLHHCDNPPCADITDLFLGTTDDNVQDKMRKNRHGCPPRNRLTVTCPCGVIFEVPASRHDARFCSLKCRRIYEWRSPPTMPFSATPARRRP